MVEGAGGVMVRAEVIEFGVIEAGASISRDVLRRS